MWCVRPLFIVFNNEDFPFYRSYLTIPKLSRVEMPPVYHIS
nr:MAG TPA: hypothetical protein [Herelleviridae sp.]DAS70816.1 MAG TPA: hypothetical protein [Caudoviricetes sp.]